MIPTNSYYNFYSSFMITIQRKLFTSQYWWHLIGTGWNWSFISLCAYFFISTETRTKAIFNKWTVVTWKSASSKPAPSKNTHYWRVIWQGLGFFFSDAHKVPCDSNEWSSKHLLIWESPRHMNTNDKLQTFLSLPGSPCSLARAVINQMPASVFVHVHVHVRVWLLQSVPVWEREEEEEADIWKQTSLNYSTHWLALR